ncbi:MAG TPA: polyprenol monophosphomannose synthase [Galbitalea sp.]|jgi:dolichol-phosphate mannosyltransferase
MPKADPASQPWGKVLVIVPTYNEIESLERVVSHLLALVPGVDVLVVDDASPDGTGELADRLAKADRRIHAIHGTAKGGLGRAYVSGFGWAKTAGYDYVVEMDADGSHPAEALPTMLALLTTARPAPGLVIGSRWVAGGSVVNWPLHRLWLSRGANVYARVWLGLKVRDITAGYRAYPIDVAVRAAHAIDSRGYSFQIEMALRVHDAGLPIVEVPIRFHEREEGRSKMSRSVVVEAMARVTRWGARRRWEALKSALRGTPRTADSPAAKSRS